MTQKLTPIHKSVREHYAKEARRGSSCCSSTPSLYPNDLLTDLPSEVSGFSLGCGDPITLAGLKTGETVLDLGSGGGLDCFLAAKQVGETGHVIGVDMTPEMLERARASAARMGIKNVEFREGFLERLPVEENSIDVVISNCVINLSPDKPGVFREIFRALKPGGRLAISDMATRGPLPEDVRADLDAWGSCVAGALDVKEYIRELTAAGFSEVSVQSKAADEEASCCGSGEAVFSASISAKKPEAGS